jgi:hypothetical protein
MKRKHDPLILDKLMCAIIKAGQASADEMEEAASNPFLINKIRNRIRELREQQFGSWEMVVATMPKWKGWLAAFAATAIILMAVSIQWQPSTVASDLDDELISISDVPD